MSEANTQPTVPVIKLELDLNEVNTILASLAKHPFEQIYSLIQKIQAQGSAQVPENNPESPPSIA